MKVFISYTVRDKEVTKSMLQVFSNSLSTVSTVGKVYIDLLDNDSAEKQNRVLSELDSSDLLLIIESSEVYTSPWVNFEIKRAQAKGIKIHSVPYAHFMAFLNSELPLESLLPRLS